MGKKLAIRGHATRGKEVIELLKMLGGENKFHYHGEANRYSYYISGNVILHDRLSIIEDDDFVIFNLEEFLEKYPYKVGDKVTLDDKLCSITWMCWECNNIYYQVQGVDVMFTKKVAADELKPYKETNMNKNKIETNMNKNKIETTGFMQIGKTVSVIFNSENYEDKVELQLGDYEIDVRDGRTFAVLKKPKYPKTYEECCKVLGISYRAQLSYTNPDVERGNIYLTKEKHLLDAFIKLRICRNAYWKIAGKQMGLDGPWEPDWNEETDIFTISNKCNKVYLNSTAWYTEVLSFPTEEMRDIFYENFKDLIEQCKELL